MKTLLLVGATGAMGREIAALVDKDPTLAIAAGIAAEADPKAPFPLFTTFEALTENYDVIVDFSHPIVVDGLLDYLEKVPTPAVICTTGLDEDQIQRIDRLSGEMPLFRSGNMSLGIHALLHLVRRARRLLPDFDIEIIEKHHRRKVDAPSGTAKMLLGALTEDPDTVSFGRYGTDAKRQPAEIGVHAVRGGTIVGEHEVLFAGEQEVIALTHQAESRGVFASGALAAAQFLMGRDPGLYQMSDLMEEKE